MNTSASLLDSYVALREQKSDLERHVRLLKDQLAPLEQQLLDEFAGEGVSGKRHAASGKLVSISRRIWARAATDRQQAAQALRRVPQLAPYAELHFNVTSLSSYFNELCKDRAADGNPVCDLNELLPTELRGLISLTEESSLSLRA